MAAKKKKVYFVNPGSENITVWAAPSSGHKDGKYVLNGCGQKALQYLYEEVNNRHDIHFNEMTPEEVKLMEKGAKLREEMAAQSAKESEAAAKKEAKAAKKEEEEEEAEGADK